MELLLCLWVMILGAWDRLIYGGAPHVQDFSRLPDIKQYNGWLPSSLASILMFVLAFSILFPADRVTWQLLLGTAVVALLHTLSWNPGHGSYLNPGNGSQDDEVLFNKLVPLVACKSSPGSVTYCCIGMGVRYGAVSVLTAVAMFASNMWLCTDFNLWFGLVGFLAGPIMYFCHWAEWHTWNTKGGWFNHQFHNGPFEALMGAVWYGGLYVSALFA